MRGSGCARYPCSALRPFSGPPTVRPAPETRSSCRFIPTLINVMPYAQRSHTRSRSLMDPREQKDADYPDRNPHCPGEDGGVVAGANLRGQCGRQADLEEGYGFIANIGTRERVKESPARFFEQRRETWIQSDATWGVSCLARRRHGAFSKADVRTPRFPYGKTRYTGSASAPDRDPTGALLSSRRRSGEPSLDP